MKLRDTAALFCLAALWGGSFLFIRIAGPVLGPVLLVALRTLLAALVLLGYAVLTHRDLAWRKHWRALLLLGAINAAIPFTLIAFAELRLTASLAAILNATTPLWTALIAALWVREPVSRRRGAGLLIGVIGVAVAVGWSPFHLSPLFLLSAAASLLAALSYGLGGVYSGVRFRGVSPLTLAFGQQLGAGLLWLTPAAVARPSHGLEPAVIASVLALAVFSTAIGYLLYFHLIAAVGPTNTLLVTFLVPIFGILWGALFLGEPVTLSLLIGLGFVLMSVALVTNIAKRQVAPRRPKAEAAAYQPPLTR